MGQIFGNFSANNQESAEFVASKFIIHLGTDTNSSFGTGGTVKVKSKSYDQYDWTTDSITYTAMDIIKQDADMLGSKFKIVIEDVTGGTVNLDYTITYE